VNLASRREISPTDPHECVEREGEKTDEDEDDAYRWLEEEKRKKNQRLVTAARDR